MPDLHDVVLANNKNVISIAEWLCYLLWHLQQYWGEGLSFSHCLFRNFFGRLFSLLSWKTGQKLAEIGFTSQLWCLWFEV